MIGEDIEILITDIGEDKVKIGINAPKNMKVFRKELLVEIENENIKSISDKPLDSAKLLGVLKQKK